MRVEFRNLYVCIKTVVRSGVTTYRYGTVVVPFEDQMDPEHWTELSLGTASDSVYGSCEVANKDEQDQALK